MDERLSASRWNTTLSPAAAGYDHAESFGYEPDSADGQGKNLLGEYLRMLVRKRKAILLFALAGALLGFLMHLGALPLYRARTSLDIQALNGDFMNMRAVAPTGDSGSGSDEAYVQTQIKMLQSDTLLEDTLRSLEAQPHPAAIERQDLLSRLKRSLHLGGNEPISYTAMLHDAAQRTKVKPLGLTRLVEITCDSWDPEFSARFCNSLTSTFREDDYATRGAEAASTSAWLTHQVADVRQQVEQSEKKLEAATGENGLVLSQQNTSVSEDRLRQVQEELVRAQADRMEKQAALEVSQSAPVDSLPSVVDNPNYRQSQQQLADLKNKVAQLVPPLTEENPKVIHLRSQIAELQNEMQQQRDAIVRRLMDDFASAKHREDLLRVTYDTQEQSTSGELVKTNQVNLLRREVEGEQQLYQTLLQRAKEAGFASAMHVNTIRVVDAAKAQKTAVSPRRGSAVGVGFLLGLLFGVGVAFYKERTSGVIHFPGEIQKLLHVQELGVIPNIARRRRRLYTPEVGKLPATGSALFKGLARPPAKPASAAVADDQVAIGIWKDNFSVVAEAYRNTTFSILLASRAGGPAKTYVVSSPNSGEGKTSIVSNLGVALSQSQRRVVILDGDMRKPSLHKALGISNTLGLRDVLRGSIDASAGPLEAFCQQTTIPNLSVVTAGSGNEEVTELLHSPRASALLARLGEAFDLVLIDTPPMLHMADARIFADHADGVILVFRAGVTNLEQAHAAHDIFVHDRVRILGTILNDFNPAREGKGQYYESYYRYSQAAEAPEEDVAHV